LSRLADFARLRLAARFADALRASMPARAPRRVGEPSRLTPLASEDSGSLRAPLAASADLYREAFGCEIVLTSARAREGSISARLRPAARFASQ